MSKALTTEDMIAAFKEKGGSIKRLKTGATSGILNKEWKRLVRANPEPVEIVTEPKPFEGLHLRAGYGAIA